MKSLAVLLTVHNRRDKTLKCLSILFRQIIPVGIVLDVFLTDDGSTDGTTEAVLEQFPKVHIIKGDGNLYWNRGMYVAWKAAVDYNDYDFYLWLNDDTYLYDDAIKYMLDTNLAQGRKSIIVGATCSATDPNNTTYGGFVGKTKLQVNGSTQKVLAFNGNVVLIPKSVYKILGTNDPYFRHSFGDNDYGLRAKKAGISCYLTAKHVGICEEHERMIKCFDSAIPLGKRLKHFYSPLGMNPFEFFHMEKRSNGYPKALWVFMSTHLRVLFPKLWT